MNIELQDSIQFARQEINKAQGHFCDAQAYLAQQAEQQMMAYPLQRIQSILRIIANFQDDLGWRLANAMSEEVEPEEAK